MREQNKTKSIKNEIPEERSKEWKSTDPYKFPWKGLET